MRDGVFDSERLNDDARQLAPDARGGAASFFVRRWSPRNSRSRASVIILHGIGGHSGYYDELARLLVTYGIEVICYDRRGHGLSGGRRGYVSSIRMDSEDLRWLLATLDPTPAPPKCLLGDSWGSLLLLEFSSRYALAVDAVILSSPPVRVTVRRTWVASIIKTLKVLFETTLRGEPAISAPFPLRDVSADERFFVQLTNDRTTNLTMHPNAAIVTARLMFRAYRNAAAVVVPTLILVGSNDRLISVRSVRRLRDNMIHAAVEMKEFSDAYHTLYLDSATPQVAAAIYDWLLRATSGDKGYTACVLG